MPRNPPSPRHVAPARRLGLPALALLGSLVAGCGGGGSKAPGTTSEPVPLGAAKQGGILRQLGSTDVDSVDPGRTYSTPGFQLAFATGRGLYGFAPGSSKPVPDLAAEAPELAADGRSLTVKLRRGVKFAPPVNREVVAADVKYAVERAFSANVGGPYAFDYFSALEGAPAAPTTGVRTVAGITTPNPWTLKLALTRPEAPAVAAALVMPITIPVPPEYAKPFDAKRSSTYARRVIASGPYMVGNGPEGRLTGYRPGRSLTLVRNPNWDKATDFKPALLDRIEWRTGGGDAAADARQVLTGKGLSLDTEPPPAELKLARATRRGQVATVPTGGYRYVPLNTRVKPFDELDVRRAVVAAFDREAARDARGGASAGRLATHFLPPTVRGFAEAGGEKGPDVDIVRAPRGDMKRASAYMRRAGYPSGRYTGTETLLVVGASSGPGKAEAEVVRAQLEKLGFRVELRPVPADAVYTDFCQVPAKRVAVCAGAAWARDLDDPQSMLEPTFKGSSIRRGRGNTNLSQLADPRIDAAMEQAAALQGEARLKAYGAIDERLVRAAAAVPFLWDSSSTIWSKDVGGKVNPYYAALDFAFTSRR